MPDGTAEGLGGCRAGAMTARAASPKPKPAGIQRCSNCFRELYLADRSFGSTALACPVHGFDRLILTVPRDIEDWVRRNPLEAHAYVVAISLVGHYDPDEPVEPDETEPIEKGWDEKPWWRRAGKAVKSGLEGLGLWP